MSGTQKQLPVVDPHRRRGLINRALCAFSRTRLAGLMTVHIGWKLDPWLLKITRGRLSSAGPLPTAVLETRGARTGEPRRNAVLYFHDGDRVTVIASKRGAPAHPSWFHNLRAHPDVVLGDVPFHARVIEDEAERQRLWELADLVFPPFADYRRWAAETGRVIPIVQLTRA